MAQTYYIHQLLDFDVVDVGTITLADDGSVSIQAPPNVVAFFEEVDDYTPDDGEAFVRHVVERLHPPYLWVTAEPITET